MDKSEKIIIVGPSASGKDYLVNFLIEKGLKKGVTWTTRPMRDGEVNGVDYNFTNVENFNKMINNGEFYEYESFLEDWYYGSTKKDWIECNLFIKTVNGVSQISKKDRKGCFIVYLDIDENVRYDRLLERNDNNDSVKRRIESDKKDFREFEDYDLRLRGEFDPELVYELMD